MKFYPRYLILAHRNRPFLKGFSGSSTTTPTKKDSIFGTKKVFTKTTTKLESKNADGSSGRRTSEATGIAANVWGVSLKPVPKKKIVLVKVDERERTERGGSGVNNGHLNKNRTQAKASLQLNQKPKLNGVSKPPCLGTGPATTGRHEVKFRQKSDDANFS